LIDSFIKFSGAALQIIPWIDCRIFHPVLKMFWDTHAPYSLAAFVSHFVSSLDRPGQLILFNGSYPVLLIVQTFN
jgi:hypothetical protein